MIRLLLLFNVLFTSGVYRLVAQEVPLRSSKPTRTIWIGAGWTDWSMRDDAYAPGSVFNARIANLRIGHVREQGQWINYTEAALGIGPLHTQQQAAFDSLLLPVRGPVIQVGSTHKGMQLRDGEGMRYRSSMVLTKTLYYPRITRPGLVSSTTLGPEMAFEPTQRRGATLALRLSIPIIGWVKRWHKEEDNEGKAKKNKKGTGVKYLQSACLSLHGQYFFNQYLSAGFQWRLSSLTYRRGELLKLQENAWYTFVGVHY